MNYPIRESAKESLTVHRGNHVYHTYRNYHSYQIAQSYHMYTPTTPSPQIAHGTLQVTKLEFRSMQAAYPQICA